MNVQAQESDRKIQTYKLIAYRIIVPIAAAAIAIYWYINLQQGETDTFTLITFPILFAIFGGSAILLFINPRLLVWIETIGYITFVGYIILGMYSYLLLIEPNILNLAIIGLWFPFIFVMTFSMMSQRPAIMITLIIYLLILIPGIYILVSGRAERWDGPLSMYLVTFYIAIGLYIPLLYGIAVLRQTYQLVSLRAKKLTRDAEIDPLTNIGNRRALDQELSRAFVLAQLYQQSLSIIIFDIDRFKRINDTYGHLIGDTVLVAVARAANEIIRRPDVFGRWGGEEFMIISFESDLDMAIQIAERVRSKIAAQSILKGETITASFGVASFEPLDSIDSLVKRADTAMFHAKAAGRNRVESTNAQGEL
jgi:diguanylate cyclase (GGDEF)-like protein